MAFEITVSEALAILQVTRAELRFLVERGDLQEFVVRDGKGQVVRRILHYEEAVELAKKLERPVPMPRFTKQPRVRLPRDLSLLSASQAMDFMGTTPPVFNRFVADGRLPVVEDSGTARYFRRDDVTALMAALQADYGLEPGGMKLAASDELVGVVQAAKLLEVTARQVYVCVKKGVLPVARVSPGGFRRFRRKDVLKLVGTVRTRKYQRRKTA